VRVFTRERSAAIGALALVTAVWGATFVVVRDAVDRMPVFDFLAWRFVIAALVMAALRPRALARLTARELRRGAALGLVLGVAYATQTLGLRDTPPAISGFITGLFVLFTPVLSWALLGRRVPARVWLGVLLATGGLGVITLSGFSFNGGALLTLTCALLFGLHIVGLGEWSAGADAYALTTVQLATAGVLCTVVAVAGGGPGLPHGTSVWLAIAITAVAASAIAFMVQTWAQARLPATQTAVVLTLEPVFAAFSAVLFGGESLRLLTVAGGALVVLAMYAVELAPRPGLDEAAA
jgi:drug/metabolite transporter (DMT)-like permease